MSKRYCIRFVGRNVRYAKLYLVDDIWDSTDDLIFATGYKTKRLANSVAKELAKTMGRKLRVVCRVCKEAE